MRDRWLILTTLCWLLVGHALAQKWSGPVVTTNVPFDFVVNRTTLPQGNYVITAYETGHMLMIQNTEQPEYVAVVLNNNVAMNPQTSRVHTKMIFLMSNGQHVLHQISFDDHTHDIIHGKDVAELVATR